jgi:hypothetical protein
MISRSKWRPLKSSSTLNMPVSFTESYARAKYARLLIFAPQPPAQRSLALRPAHSRGHLYVTSYTEGFSHFVTSMTAPVVSGWSGRRVGLPPIGKRRLLTAHT